MKGSDGKSVQVPQAVVAQAQLGLVQPGPDGTITVPGSDGKPVKIPQTALAAAAPAVLSNMTGGSILNTRPLIQILHKSGTQDFLKSTRIN